MVKPCILLREAVDEAITDTDRRIFSQSESGSGFLLSVTHASHLCRRQLDNKSSELTGLSSNVSGHLCVCALHSGKVLCCLPKVKRFTTYCLKHDEVFFLLINSIFKRQLISFLPS